MKPDERALLLRLAELQGTGDARHLLARPGEWQFADAVAAALGLHPKRVTYLLLKWTDRGWWDYGVSARTGWLTPQGLQEATKEAQGINP